MRVRERTPCEFFAVQAMAAGDRACDDGIARWKAGDWLLEEIFMDHQALPTEATIQPDRIVPAAKFLTEYEEAPE